MRLIITPLAERDIEDIGDYIAEGNPQRAITFVAELHEQCDKIATQPQIYSLRKELGGNIRSCSYGNYVIFFQEMGQQVSIVRVLNASRDIQAQFSH